jgi:1-acyl-sn-glycerol-3-phosphate acyltransferase
MEYPNLNTTIFDTPILSKLLHYLTKFLLRVFGWHVEGQMPDIPKFIVIGAPHTSNWDFVMMLALGFALQAKLYFMGKSELFHPLIGFFFRWCGGIPVDRTKSTGMVEQMVDVIRRSERFILAVAPEGTREKVLVWKSGFYHIAKKAGIPVVFGFVDGGRKTVGVGPTFMLTDDMEADMKAIQFFYAGIVGIRPHRTSELG